MSIWLLSWDLEVNFRALHGEDFEPMANFYL